MSRRKKDKFMTLYKPVHAQFERFCKARVYGEMDFKDLMQDTVVVAFEKFEERHSDAQFLYFLFGISVKLLANANKKKHEELWNEQAAQNEQHAPSVYKQLEIEDLYKALAKLPEAQREALILFEISGFSVREIAGIQESSEDAVKQRLSRGRKELAYWIKDQSGLMKI